MSDKKKLQAAQINALTGLRFFAALAVFFFHLDRMLKTQVLSGPMGGIAVSFFFVLSGFILTYVYRDRLKWGGLKRFYFTRWARIWPLHAVCLVWAIYMMPIKPVDFPGLRMMSHWLLLQSWIPDTDYVLSLNGVAWSISTEAFFYAMFPLFLLGGLKHFWWKYLATVAFTALALFAMTSAVATPGVITGSNLHQISHFNPAMRLLEFVSGMATAYVFMSNRVQSLTILRIADWPVNLQTIVEFTVLALAGTSFYLLTDAGFYRWIKVTAGLGDETYSWFIYCGGMPFHALCIYVFAQSNGWLARFLGTRLMVFLGEISFALYMVHRQVMWFFVANYWTGSSLPYWAMVSCCLVMTLGFSALLFLLVEMPMKTALMKCYDGKYFTGFKGLIGQTKSVFAKPSGWLFIALAFAPAVFMSQLSKYDSPSRSAQQILATTDVVPVKFGNHVTLAAWQIEPKRLGSNVSLVWSAERPTTVRHEYSLANSKFSQRGKMKLEQGETVQEFFVHRRFWSDNQNFEIKLLRGKVSQVPRPASTASSSGDVAGNTAAEPVYRIAVLPEGDTVR